MFFKNVGEALFCKDKNKKLELVKSLEIKNIDHESKTEIKELVTPSYNYFCKVYTLKTLPKRKKPVSKEGKAEFLHSVAHIEYSAIDIALDATYRFRGLPFEYYQDWLEVAKEEVKHFEMIEELLSEFGCKYGDCPVHDGLFCALQKTSNSLIERMALLPRYMEAGGLDANSLIIQKLQEDIENQKIINVLMVILEEEVDHVRKGDRWYKYAHQKTNQNFDYVNIIKKHYPNAFNKPCRFNKEARLKAGFSHEELEYISSLAGKN